MDEVIRLAVFAKLAELDAIPVGNETGRILTGNDIRKVGIEITDDQLRAGLALTFRDIAERLGIQFFQAIPPAAMEQFALRTIMRNEDCAGLLKSLINSFMITYQTEETSDEAYGHLVGLESLRAKVAQARGVTYTPVGAASKSTH